MGAGADHGHQYHVTSKNVKQWQRTNDCVLGLKQHPIPKPAIIDNTGIFMLRNFWHARCSPRMKIGSDAVFSCILKIKYAVLLCQLCIEIHDLRGVGDGDFRTN